jgi:hypothetical protein
MRMEIMKVRSGSILVLAVIMVAILLIIGLALIKLGLNSRLTAIRSQLVINAKTAADAGITKAVKGMRARYDAGQWPVQPLPDETTPFSEAGTSYSFHVGNDPCTAVGYGYLIDSTGMTGNVSRTVHSKLQIASTFSGIGVKKGIDITNNAVVGTVPVGADLIIQTNDTSKGAVVLYNGVQIPGDVVVGPGGNTDYAIDTKKDAAMEGSRPAAEVMDFKDVTAPTGLPVRTLAFDANGNASAISSGQYNGATLIKSGQTFKVTGGTFANPTVIFITGSFTLQNSAKLEIAQNSVVFLYLGNYMQADIGSIIGSEGLPITGKPTDAQVAAAATSFFIYGLPTCEKIVLQNSSNFYGAIYAPQADLDIKNSGAMYGALVGNSVRVYNTGGFYYVDALRSIVGPFAPQSTFVIARWWEE